MSDINELQLNHPSISDTNDTGVPGFELGERSDRSKWAVLIVLLCVAAGVLGYVAWKRRAVPPPVAATPAATAAAPAVAARPAGPLVEAEKITLPPLSETDAIVRELVVKLSSHPKALAWLATDGLIENFAVATLNLSEGSTPVAHWPALKPRARFSVVDTPRGPALDPKSYHRYDEYAAAIGALDPAGTARLYLTLKPRIVDAYRQLGYPEGDFDPVLERAFGVLLTTPVVEGEIPLHQKVLSYQFVDPKIEALPASAKQLLRMGPENMKIVQDKLREIARQLGLHPAG